MDDENNNYYHINNDYDNNDDKDELMHNLVITTLLRYTIDKQDNTQPIALLAKVSLFTKTTLLDLISFSKYLEFDF